MGAESSLPYRPVRSPRVLAWILLAAVFVALVLLASAGFLGVMNPGHSPVNEPGLMGPFRWPYGAALA